MPAQRARTILELPESTAQCEIGPEIRQSPGAISVRYDAEAEGGVSWTSIRFGSALASRFTPECAITELMPEAYSRLCEIEHSTWLSELRARASAQHQIIPPSQRHFMVFFDHVGCLEVVAESYEVA